MLHAKALATVVACDIYKELCTGRLRGGEWKVEKPVSFYRFREKLAKQMLEHLPTDRKCPGDEKMRAATQQHKTRRCIHHNFSSGSGSTVASGSAGLTKKDFDHSKTRLCGDLTPLCDHMMTCIPIPGKGHKICVVCGDMAYHVCMKCVGPDGRRGVALHIKTHKGDEKGANTFDVPCFYHCHNTSFFGLAKNDHKLVGKRKCDYAFPTAEEMQNHRKETKIILDPPVVPLPKPVAPVAPVAPAAPAAMPPLAATGGNDNPHGTFKHKHGELAAPL